MVTKCINLVCLCSAPLVFDTGWDTSEVFTFLSCSAFGMSGIVKLVLVSSEFWSGLSYMNPSEITVKNIFSVSTRL